jgi:hypothetical protein
MVSSTKRTPLQSDLKLFHSIYHNDIDAIYQLRQPDSHHYAFPTAKRHKPSQGFLSATHDLLRKYMNEKIYYNDKTFVKLWLLFAAHVDLFKGEIQLASLQTVLTAVLPSTTPKTSGGSMSQESNNAFILTKPLHVITGLPVTPGDIYDLMFSLTIGKYLTSFYLSAAQYYETTQEYVPLRFCKVIEFFIFMVDFLGLVNVPIIFNLVSRSMRSLYLFF